MALVDPSATDDGLLLFFHNDYEKYLVPPELDEEVRQLVLQYTNAVQAVECHNEMIAFHVGELQQLREQLGRQPRDNTLTARLEHCKLDLGDQRTKRNLKRQAQADAAAKLQDRITRIQATCPKAAEEGAQQSHAAAHKRPAFVLPVRPARKYRVWDDEEITGLLREADCDLQ